MGVFTFQHPATKQNMLENAYGRIDDMQNMTKRMSQAQLMNFIHVHMSLISYEIKLRSSDQSSYLKQKHVSLHIHILLISQSIW